MHSDTEQIYIYIFFYIHIHIYIYIYIYIYKFIGNYFLDYFVTCLKMVQFIYGILFLYDVG